jgi:hypothetical protein
MAGCEMNVAQDIVEVGGVIAFAEIVVRAFDLNRKLVPVLAFVLLVPAIVFLSGNYSAGSWFIALGKVAAAIGAYSGVKNTAQFISEVKHED